MRDTKNKDKGSDIPGGDPHNRYFVIRHDFTCACDRDHVYKIGETYTINDADCVKWALHKGLIRPVTP